MRTTKAIRPLLPAAAVLLATLVSVWAADRTEVPTALDTFRPFIGQWRGVGQVRRGSASGAWQEQAEWRFDFSGEKPSIVLDITDGKHVKSLSVAEKSGELVAHLKSPNEASTPLSVTQAGKKTVFETANDASVGYRLTLTNLNEKRTLLLLETRPEGSSAYRRLGEVGYTREGTRLATSGGSGPECIVTGGTGTIPVTHDGKTYYVCCTGCKQAFEADPEAILAAAAERNQKAARNE